MAPSASTSSSLVAWSAYYGIPVQRELVIAWICGALACASLGRPPAADPPARPRLAADRPRPQRLRLHPRRRRLARDRRPRPPDDRLRPLPLLRRDADRMAPGPPLRARRRQLVGRRLHAHLHLLLHRPLRDSRASSGHATGSPSCASPSAWSRWRSPASPPTSPSRRRRPGWRRRWGCSTKSTAPPRRAGRCSAWAPRASSPRARRASTWSPPSPRCTPPSPPLVAMFLWGRVAPALRPLLALYPLAMGLTLMATGEHYFFDVAARLALRRRGDGGLGLVGAPPRHRPGADGLKTPEGSTKSTRRRGRPVSAR